MSTKSRLFPLLGATIVFTAVACADATTGPQPTGARAPRDTTAFIQGDTLQCRSGWQVITGRYVCNEEAF